MSKCVRYFFAISRNISRSETGHLLLRIIVESFKLHFFFLFLQRCEHKLGQMLQANLDSRDFSARFPVSVNSWQWEVCLHCAWICLTPSQNSNVGGQTCHVWTQLEPLFSWRVHVGSKQRHHSSQVCVDVAGKDRYCLWLNEVVGRLYTDVAVTIMSNFRRVGTAFSGDSRKPGLFCSLDNASLVSKRPLTKIEVWRHYHVTFIPISQKLISY